MRFTSELELAAELGPVVGPDRLDLVALEAPAGRHCVPTSSGPHVLDGDCKHASRPLTRALVERQAKPVILIDIRNVDDFSRFGTCTNNSFIHINFDDTLLAHGHL